MKLENAGHAVYVLLAADTPLIAFEALSQSEAKGLLREEWLRDDLREARSEEQPIWDGKAKLSVRRAILAETEQYHAFAEPSMNGSGDLVIVYLVELDG